MEPKIYIDRVEHDAAQIRRLPSAAQWSWASLLLLSDLFIPDELAAAGEMLGMGELLGMTFLHVNAKWLRNFGQKCARCLRSPDEQAKWQTLQQIAYFATYFPGKADFRSTIPRLLEIYRFDANEVYRMLALAALHAIGDEKAMQQLAQHVSEEKCPRVRKLTRSVLVAYHRAKEEEKMQLYLAA